MKTKLLSLVLCFFALFSFAGSASVKAESEIDRINDQMDVLTEAEEAVLAELLEERYKKYDIQVMLIATKSTSHSVYSEDSAFAAAKSQAELFYMDTNGLSANQNGVVLVYYEFEIHRGLYIAPFGELGDIYTESKTDSVLDDIEVYFKRGSTDPYGGFEKFIFCNDVVWEKRNSPSPLTIVIALCIAMIIAFIIVSSMKAKLKTVRNQPYANEYLKKGSFKLVNSRDIFLYRSVTRVKINRNNGSGGGRSGGGSRGGGGRSL